MTAIDEDGEYTNEILSCKYIRFEDIDWTPWFCGLAPGKECVLLEQDECDDCEIG